MSTPDKLFITAQQLLDDSFDLGLKILDSGFKPNYIVGVWRGGTPVGIAVQELLDYCGIHTDHISIRTSSYEDVDKRAARIRIHGLTYLTRQMNAEDRLLIVDDVFDSGRSVKAILEKLKNRCRRNLPEDIRIATAYYKPLRNKTDIRPDYYIHETDKWLVFPHEMSGLDEAELRANKPHLESVLNRLNQLSS